MKGKDGAGGLAGAAHRSRQAWPAELRLHLAQAIVDRGVTSATLSKALGISLNTLQDWAFRYRREGAAAMVGQGAGKRPAARPASAKSSRRDVVEAKREHPEHGARRIRDELARYGTVKVSEPTVRRILHEEGLMERSEAAGAKPQPEPKRFERAEPNQLWQSDIFTFLLRRHERLYVAAFMDDYSRYIVSVVLAHHQRSSLVMEALARGIAEYGAPREVLTDQGRQYVAWRGSTEFAEELRRQGIQHIKSRPHHPETLGKIERFWKTLWEEFLSRTVFGDYADCERRVGLFVQAYNFRRPHQGIGGMVPADRFFRAAPQVREAIERGIAPNALALAKQRPARKPFYLVGRLGEQDLSIALTGNGIFVKLGEVEQTLPLWREVSDEEARAERLEAEAPAAADAEVADEGGGPRPAGAGEVPDDPQRALGGHTGERRGGRGGDLAGDVLPAGDEGLERDAASAGAGGEGSVGGLGAGQPDRVARGEGEEAGAGGSASGAAAGADPQGGAGVGGDAVGTENVLDPAWRESFDDLGGEDGGLEGSFDPDEGWRGRALSWERKLAGAETVRDGEELHSAAAAGRGEPASLPGGGGSDLRGPDGIGGGTQAEAVPQPLPEPDAPRAEGTGGGAGTTPPGAPGDPLPAAGASGGERAAATRLRAAPEAPGDDGPGAGDATGLPGLQKGTAG